MKEDKFTAKFLIADRGDGCDTIMHADQIVIVPIETLSAGRKKTLEAGDYGKLLAHGGEFPGIYLSEIFEALDEAGKFEEMLSACRLTRLRLDGKEMPTDEEE